MAINCVIEAAYINSLLEQFLMYIKLYESYDVWFNKQKTFASTPVCMNVLALLGLLACMYFNTGMAVRSIRVFLYLRIIA